MADGGAQGEGAIRHAVLESIPLPAFLRNPAGRLVECNRLFTELAGRRPEDLAGTAVATAMPPGEFDMHEAPFLPHFEPGGGALILCVLRDVTEERKAKRRLEESEARYARLAELTHEGVVLHRDGHILDVNDALCRMTGWDREDLIGRHYAWLIAPECHDEAQKRVRERWDHPYRLMMRRRDGELFPAEAHGRDLIHGGEPLRVVAVADITDRVEAEHAVAERETLYRQMFENNQAVKLLIDPQTGAVVDANHAAERFYGWGLDRLRGMNITDINVLPPDQVRAEMARAKAEDRLYFRFPHRVASGEVRAVEVFTGPVTYGGRTLLHSIIHDVTDREKAREELEAKTRALETSNADLQQFAYVASHDLQEPLRMVVSYLQLLQRRYGGKLDGEADEFIGFAVDGAKRMSHLIQDLLAYSRVETQGAPLDRVELAAVLDSAMANLTVTIEQSGARIYACAMPAVLGDEAQLTSLFQNLLGNAIKYRHPDRRPEVRITAEIQGAEWLFTVADNGIGIAPAYHERIFLIFQRLHTHTQYDGTGIGLALARRIVGRHGGRIWVESAEGEGSRFRFTLKAAG